MIDGLWENANRISEIGVRLEGIAGILEIIADRNTDNSESGALWTCAEWLKKHGEELELLSIDTMQLNKGKQK